MIRTSRLSRSPLDRCSWLTALALAAVACASPRASSSLSADNSADRATRVEIPTEADRLIVGDLYGEGEHVVVILAHGGYSSLASWAPSALSLQAFGFRVLVVEARAAAELADGRETPCLYDAKCLAQDVLAAIRHLRGRGAERISLMGGSMGGAAIAEASADSTARDVECLVLLAPAITAAPERMRGRKLFIATREDANSAGLRLPSIQAQFDRAPEPKRFVLLEGSAHGQRVLASPQGDAVLREIAAFLRSETLLR